MNSIQKDITKFFTKCLIFLVIPICYFSLCIFTDIFNVFHPFSIRKTDAEPNKSFLRVNYVIHNPQKFDSFIFGSSRVGLIPEGFLNEFYGEKQKWFNMTYSQGLPKEHYDNLVSFLNNNIKIKNVIIAVDEISWTVSPKEHENQLLRKPYSEYEKSKLKFYLSYINQFNKEIFFDVLKGKDQTDSMFGLKNKPLKENDLSIGKNINHKSNFTGEVHSYKEVLIDIKNIVDLCKKNNINLTIITNPIWKNTFLDACKYDYLFFLKELAQITPYLNFSGLNQITTNGENYYEGSHYRYNVGLLILQCLDKNITYNRDEQYLEELKKEYFGTTITPNNVEIFIEDLKKNIYENY